MKVFVVGAGGPSGRACVYQALKAGMKITALLHQTRDFSEEYPDVPAIIGDVLNPSTYEEHLKGHDAVVSFLGVSASVPDRDVPPLRSEGTAKLILTMQKHGIRRLICITSQGAGDSRFTSGLFGWLIVPLFMRRRFRDVNVQEDIIRNSDMDFTIVRPPMLTYKPLTKKYKHGRLFTWFFSSIGREDLGHFVISLLSENAYIRKHVSVGS